MFDHHLRCMRIVLESQFLHDLFLNYSHVLPLVVGCHYLFQILSEWKINQFTSCYFYTANSYPNLYPSTPMLSKSSLTITAWLSCGRAAARAQMAANTIITFILERYRGMFIFLVNIWYGRQTNRYWWQYCVFHFFLYAPQIEDPGLVNLAKIL